MLNILVGFIDVPGNHFTEMIQVASMWTHEMCRSVLDRFTDGKLKKEIHMAIRQVAIENFKIKERKLVLDADAVLFTYGSPEGRT